MVPVEVTNDNDIWRWREGHKFSLNIQETWLFYIESVYCLMDTLSERLHSLYNAFIYKRCDLTNQKKKEIHFGPNEKEEGLDHEF